MNPRCAGMWLACFVLVLMCRSAPSADEPAAKPPKVPIAHPVVRMVSDHESFTGRLEAQSRVEVRARVTGYLLEAPFQEGAEVKKGELLFKIDARPYQADLDRAEAELRLAQARLKLADVTLARAKANHASKIISQEELEQAVADQSVATARVRASQAVHELARLNLDFTRVSAPIDGRIGRRLVDPGNLVKQDETVLATIVRQESVFVLFDIDERTLLRLRHEIHAPGKKQKTTVSVGLANEEGYPHRAEVDFSDNQVNAETGTLRLRALLPNKDQRFFPGLFARVRLQVGAPFKALLVPPEAVLSDGGAKAVYVVNDKGVIESRPVTLGQELDGLRVIKEGLKPGDRVVVGRQQRVRPGMTVRPVEDGRPTDASPAAEPPAPARPEADARPARMRGGHVIVVEVRYPGANAQTLRDTVAFPIEEQVGGMEGVLALRSRCDNDGKYTLAITLARGSPDLSQVLVQNRVELAMPVLPAAVRQRGATIRKQAPGVPLVVALHSPAGIHDRLYLSSYAQVQIKNELTRLPGVAGATLVGPRNHGLLVWLDPDQLAARKLVVADVLKALKEQSLEAKELPDRKKGETTLTLSLGRLDEPEALADVILKTADGGGRVRLKDVARLELGAVLEDSWAALDGKPAVVLALHSTGTATAREVGAAVRARAAELRERLPEGLDLSIPFDFTTQSKEAASACLLLDLDLPPSASAQRREKLLQHAESLLREVRGVEHTLVLSTNPFDLFGGGPCILAALAPDQAKDEVVKAIRTRLDEMKTMTVRVRDLSAPGSLPHCGYPIDLAIHGREPGRVREFARKIAERLGRSRKLQDVGINPECLPQPLLNLEIDRAQARDRGVSLEDIQNALQVYLGGFYVNDFNRFGRTWQITVQVAGDAGRQSEDLRKLRVRNDRGEIVALGQIVSLRPVNGPPALDYFEMSPMVEITANPAPGVSREEARTLCSKLADEARRELRLPAGYRLSWLD